MLSDKSKKQIVEIWDNYVKANKTVLDTKGRVISDIDERRLAAIVDIKQLISKFSVGYINLAEFKTALDGYNKRNNLWGFSATKGQMFFNQLTKTNEQSPKELAGLISTSIREPSNLDDALAKIERFERFVGDIFSKAKDKRTVPNPGSVGYFLSYFWQIHDNRKWPLLYTSLTRAFTDLEIWQEHPNQKETYRAFYELNAEIKSLLEVHTKHEITNWDAEHAFWHFSGKSLSTSDKHFRRKIANGKDEHRPLDIKANFDLTEYLIPKVAKLVELGNETERSKASQYEKLVAEIFHLLDFDVKPLGQGSGRNPDAILRFREENTAFLVDAKAYREGYSMGVDDRAIKEYIAHHCPQLQKEGYKKIGFIIVSNSFKSNLEGFINEITWNTDIKRFILLTSEALLYLLAYKTKDKHDLATIIERLVSMGNLVDAANVIEKFDDI